LQYTNGSCAHMQTHTHTLSLLHTHTVSARLVDTLGTCRETSGMRVEVCCSVLQCVAVCCSVLQWVAAFAVCCSVLQCFAVFCSVLQCVAVCYSVLQYVAVCCNMLKRAAVCCSTLTAAMHSARILLTHSGRVAKSTNLNGMHVAVCCSVLQCVAVHAPQRCTQRTACPHTRDVSPD